MTRSASKTGVLIGGTGLIGGTLLYAFKDTERYGVSVLSPNSKELSLRVPEDIRSYFERVEADFIINCAIASIDSDPQLTMEVTALGSIHLARVARELGIPYIHFSSGALMPNGLDVREEERLPLDADMPNYAKGKLIAELALEDMARNQGLDYTCIRLAIVYGTHDHKIQGFQHLLFSLVNRSMPFLLAGRGSAHSYTSAKKLPAFVSHVLHNRDEFSGQTYHFVDPEPVPLGHLILTIKSLLGTRTPRAVYVPYVLARLLMGGFARILRLLGRIGLEARPAAELVFLKNFYESQALSSEKLKRSSFVDEDPDATILRELPALIDYYVDRWVHFNLIDPQAEGAALPRRRTQQFIDSPTQLLSSLIREQEEPFLEQCAVAPAPLADDREREDELAVTPGERPRSSG